MSVSPAQNFSKPPPVPDSPTVTLAFGLPLTGALVGRARVFFSGSGAPLPSLMSVS